MPSNRKVSSLSIYSITDNIVDPETATSVPVSGAAPSGLKAGKKKRKKKRVVKAGSSTSMDTEISGAEAAAAAAGKADSSGSGSSGSSSSDDEDLLDTLKKRGHDAILEKLEAVQLGENAEYCTLIEQKQLTATNSNILKVDRDLIYEKISIETWFFLHFFDLWLSTG